MGKPYSREKYSLETGGADIVRRPTTDFISAQPGNMAAATKRGKAREVISRKVQFLGKFLSPVLDEVTMIKLRSHIRLSKGFRTKLRLTTHGISCGVKSTSFIRGKLPYDFTPLEDIQHVYIDQAYHNVLLCVSPFSGGQTEIVAYKFQDDTDARLFQQMYCELTRKPPKATTVPIATRSGYVEFDKQDDGQPDYEGDANWMFSQGDATEQPVGLTNGHHYQDTAGSVSGHSVRHSLVGSVSPVTTGRQRTLQEAVQTRAAQTYQSQAASVAVTQTKEHHHHAAPVTDHVTPAHAQQPTSDTMLRDIDEISRELREIRALLVRGDEASLIEARRRIYQSSTTAPGPRTGPDSGRAPTPRQTIRGTATAVVPDHRRQQQTRSDPRHQQEIVYTGTGRGVQDYRMSRGVARGLPSQIRSRSSDSHLRYGSRVPSQNSLNSERVTVSTNYVPAGPRVLRPIEFQTLGSDHFVVYPTGPQRRSRSATRYDFVYR